MARLGYKQKSVGIARQSAYETENTTDASFSYGVLEAGIPEADRAIYDVMVSAAKSGTYYPPASGARMGKVSLKATGLGFKRSYDPTSEEAGITTGVLPIHILLLGLGLGSASDSITTDAEFLKGFGLFRPNFTASKAATYGSGDVGVVTSTTVLDVGVGNGADYQPGHLFACGDTAADTAPSVSWIKTISTDTLTFADAMANLAVAGDDTWSTVVAAITDQQPVPFTLRILGDNAADKVALIGCQVDKITLTLKAQEVLQVEFDVSFGGMSYYGTGGGLQSLTVLSQLPSALIGGEGGRVTMGVGGAAMAAVTVGEITIEVENTPIPILSIGAANGIAERYVAERKTTVTVMYPRSSGDITGTTTYWDAALRAGTAISLAGYSGTAPGKGFSFFFPALHIFETVKAIDVGGVKYEELKMRPGQYTDDTGSTAPADTPARLGWW